MTATENNWKCQVLLFRTQPAVTLPFQNERTFSNMSWLELKIAGVSRSACVGRNHLDYRLQMTDVHVCVQNQLSTKLATNIQHVLNIWKQG